MQTFIPFSNFKKSARCLDRLRLGKQRLEAKECVQVNRQRKNKTPLPGLTERYCAFLWTRYRNHPSALMWSENEFALCLYGIEVCREWERRGYNDNTKHYFVHVMVSDYDCDNLKDAYDRVEMPNWWGRFDVHASHMAVLYQKNPEFYGPQWVEFFKRTPYTWPTNL